MMDGALVKNEIVALHNNFVDWYNGKMSKSVFDDKIKSHFDSNFKIVFPDGSTHNKDVLSTLIYADYNTSHNFGIKIKDVQLQMLGDGYVIAAYKEYQYTGKKIELKLNTLSVLKTNETGITWLHIHETKIK